MSPEINIPSNPTPVALTLGGEPAEEPEVSDEERVTTSEIIILWTEHNKQDASLKKSSKELKETRTRLGQ